MATVTDFSGDNAQALRNALAAVVSGGTVKIAGLCAGVTNKAAQTRWRWRRR
jgi:threonine dehydrogenase-like Zn-dependent dehydrogenase